MMNSGGTIFGVSWRRAKKFVYGLSIFFLLFSQMTPYGFADDNGGELETPEPELSSDDKVTICHFDDEGVGRTLRIGKNAAKKHLKNHDDDHRGPCEEVCDEVDNDGDKDVDEGFEKGGECSVGVGECAATGSYICNESGEGTECSAVPGKPGEEICDGLDNDCDGLIDEGFDEDGDKIVDCRDNCPLDHNPGQEDDDKNGTGDVCEDDGRRFCADEHELIDIDGLTEVRYGAKDSFFFDTVDEDIYCSNDHFGDPIKGTFKHCDCRHVPRGHIKITKYLCPEGTEIDNDWRPDENGDMSEDAEKAGCVLAEGYGFGHDLDHVTTPSGPSYVPTNVKERGTTNESGMLLIDVEPGKYLVGETDGGTRVGHEDVMGLLCSNSPIGGERENNLEAISVDDEQTVYCTMINEKEPEYNLHITKYLCPFGTDVTDVELGKDGDLNVDPADRGCRVLEGVGFAYDNNEISANGDPEYISEDFTVIGKTDVNGMIWTKLDPAGIKDNKYMLGELNKKGDRASADEVLAWQCTTAPVKGKRTNNLEQIDYSKADDIHCVAFNEDKRKETAKVIAHKIMCNDESLLPNRGKDGAPDITKKTAKKRVKKHSPDCRFEDDWKFQIAKGKVKNPGDNMKKEAGKPWRTFGPTDKNGMAMMKFPVEGKDIFRVREVLKPGYVGFAGNPTKSNYSAEIYCHKDGKGYDNFDRIDGIKKGEEYYCVAFNAPKPAAKVIAHKIVCEEEKHLPNRGTVGAPDIDSDTAQNRVDKSKGNCWFQEGRDFQIAPDSAANPGDNTGEAGDPWTTFGPTDANGMAMTRMRVEDNSHFRVREVWNDDYIKFGTNKKEYSAEMYCHVDGKTYDNYDRVDGVVGGSKYYCVAFNVEDRYLAYEEPVCEDGVVYARFSSDFTGSLYVGDYIVNNNQWFKIKDGGGFIPYTTTQTEGMTLSQDASGKLTIKLNGNGPWASAKGLLEFVNADAASWNSIPGGDGLDDCTKCYKDHVEITGGNDGHVIDSFFDVFFDIAVTSSDDTFEVFYREDQEGCTLKPVACDGNIYARLQYGDVDTHFILDDEYTDPVVRIRKTTTAGKYRFIMNEKSDAEGKLTIYNGVYTQLKYNDGGDGLETGGKKHQDKAKVKNDYTIKFDLGTTSHKDTFRFWLVDDPICVEQGSIQGRKYYDVNTNGNFDELEKTVAGDPNRLDDRNIKLYDKDRNLLDEMKTGDDGTAAGNVDKGQYRFVGLSEGTYYVCEESKDGWAQTQPSSGPVDGSTSLYCHKVTLAAGQEKGGVQFGNYKALCEPHYVNYAASVVSSNQLLKKNGSPVNADRSDTDHALGAPDATTSPVDGFYSLGFGGSITVKFAQPVYNGSGDDLSFHEVTNNRDSYPEETALVEVSQDGINWFTAGSISTLGAAVKYLDIDGLGLAWIQYVRVTDTSNPDIHNSNADAYDLDAIDAVYTCEEYVEEQEPVEPICGNSIKEGEEECDGSDGVGENQSCTDECLLNTEEEEESNGGENNPTETSGGGGGGGSSFPGTLNSPSGGAGPNTSDDGPDDSTPPSLLETGNPDGAPDNGGPTPQPFAMPVDQGTAPGNGNNPVPMLLVTGAEDEAKVATGISFVNGLLVAMIMMLVVFGSGILRKDDTVS